MNTKRRKELQKVANVVEVLAQDVEHIKEDEENSYDNLPEGLQCSIRGEKMEENIDVLEEICDELLEIKEKLEDLIRK